MTPEIRARIGRPGASRSNFKGGWLSRGGNGGEYFRVPVPREERHLHPTVDSKGYIARSHFVWNTANPINPVQRGEVMHHLNESSLDDRPENLVKVSSQAEHWQRYHASAVTARRTRDAKGRFT